MDNKGTEMRNILEFKNVVKRFSGAGKSTLMKVIDGLYKKDGGEIYFDGQPWDPADSAQARMCGIAMVHQELNIIPLMTVTQNLFLGREIKRRGSLALDDARMRSETAAGPVDCGSASD